MLKMYSREENIKFIKDRLGRIIKGKDGVCRMIIGCVDKKHLHKIYAVYVIIDDPELRGLYNGSYDNQIMLNESEIDKTHIYADDIDCIYIQ